jgi:hypothetical protein
VLAGLVRRRALERDLFLSASPSEGTTEQAGSPDDAPVDMPRLKAPFQDTVATRLLASLVYGEPPSSLPVHWLDDKTLTEGIRALQSEYSLVADGDVGAVTWAAITEPPADAVAICQCCGQPLESAHGR